MCPAAPWRAADWREGSSCGRRTSELEAAAAFISSARDARWSGSAPSLQLLRPVLDHDERRRRARGATDDHERRPSAWDRTRR